MPVMLRIYCLQQWYALSDPMAEEKPTKLGKHQVEAANQ